MQRTLVSCGVASTLINYVFADLASLAKSDSLTNLKGGSRTAAMLPGNSFLRPVAQGLRSQNVQCACQVCGSCC